ncbi:MAG: DUF4333 domain-containing protein [Nocardioides sp.]|uniref:DUF4333 domain-containing protein n=1 Tax=Nocardioides sp. TaxID=35761 RepID=UPI003D6C6EC0
MLRRIATAAVASAALFTLASCGTPTVSKEDLEQTVSDQLEAQVGQKPDKIDCPEDLTGKVGETMKCTLTAGSDELPVQVKVTGVDGTDVKFSAEVLAK